MNAVNIIYRISLAGDPVAAFLIRRGILAVIWVGYKFGDLIRCREGVHLFCVAKINRTKQKASPCLPFGFPRVEKLFRRDRTH
jgi:hypothetical protein